MKKRCLRQMCRYLSMFYLLGLFIISNSRVLAAQWIPLNGVGNPDKIQVQINQQAPDVIILEVSIPGIWMDDIFTKEGRFTVIQIPEGGIAGDIGRPQYPALRELIALPEGGNVTWEIVSRSEVIIPLPDLTQKPLYPQQPPIEKRPGALANAPFVWDRDYYSQDHWLPESAVEMGERGYLRAYSFVPVTIFPVQVNPQRSEVKITQHLTVRLQVQGVNFAKTQERIRRLGTLDNRILAHQLFQIPPSIQSTDELPIPPLGMLIISDPQYATNVDLMELASWKAQKGYQVTIATTDETGTSRDQIKAYIQNAYDNWEVPPVHVLLIGDTDDIPYYLGSTSEHPATDLSYACLEGADFFADVGLGRLSVITPAQLGNIIQKILNYERVEWTGNDDWETHGSFLASTDNWQVSEGTHNFVISTYLNPAGYTCDRFYTHTYSANIGQVIAAINQGRSLVIYSGHGGVTLWADGPAMYQSQVRDLYNQVFPFVCSFACETGQYQAEECFGETWIRDPEAGLAFLGASVSSLWDQDDILERRLFEGFFNNQFPGDTVNFTWLSGMIDYAKIGLYQYYGNTEVVRMYLEMYNLLGDPSVDIWTSVPQITAVNHPSVIPVGQQEVTVQVTASGAPVENAMVCLMNDEVWGSAYTNSAGQTTIQFENAPLVPAELNVYVTGHNLQPYQSIVQIITPSGPYVGYINYVLHDPTGNNNGLLDYNEAVTLDMTLKNLGTAPATNVNATLHCTDNFVTFTDSTATFGNMAVEQQVTILNAFAFQISSEIPDNYHLTFTVTATSTEGNWESNFSLLAHAPNISVFSVVVDDSTGNNNGILDPGETADIEVTVTNSGSAASAAMVAQLSTLEALISIPSGTGNFSALNPTQPATSSFTVSASSVCPLGYQAGLILNFHESSTNRNSIDRFEIEIGDDVCLPSGPDAYGYSAYDSSEIYGASTYNWVEINSQLGGPGTISNITNDDQTLYFSLPFTFRYYGQDYDSISICSNGWVSMGRTTNTDYIYSEIPSPDGPPAMLAPHWEDLNPQNGGTIWVWADATGGRYVVEYYRIHQYTPSENWDTFEIILYNPTMYPTSTGDGKILFQYQTANDFSECTVGIENRLETIGIQYLFNGMYDSRARDITPQSAILFTTGTTQAPGSVSGSVSLIGGSSNVQSAVVRIGAITTNPSSTGSYLLSNVPSGLQTMIASLYGYGTITMPNLIVPESGTLSSVNVNLPYLEPPSDLAGVVENYQVHLAWQPSEFTDSNSSNRHRVSRGIDESLEFLGYNIYRNGVKIDSLIQTTEHTDIPTQTGTYEYYVVAEYTIGESDSTNHVSLYYQASKVPEDEQVLLPEHFALHQNYPNPFNPATTIPFDLPQGGTVSVQVFNILGQQVATVVNQALPAGFHRVTWNGSNLSSGLYFYRIMVHSNGALVFKEFRKAVMIR